MRDNPYPIAAERRLLEEITAAQDHFELDALVPRANEIINATPPAVLTHVAERIISALVERRMHLSDAEPLPENAAT